MEDQENMGIQIPIQRQTTAEKKVVIEEKEIEDSEPSKKNNRETKGRGSVIFAKNLKQNKKALAFCQKVTKLSIYILAFLLPLFFLPWTANALDFNKQALLIVLVFLALFAWLVKILIGGKAELNLHVFSIFPLILLVIFSLATIFSISRYGSFWGWPLNSSENLLNLIGLTLLYFVIVNALEKKEIFYLFLLLVFSGFLAIVFGIFQFFGKFLLPFDFTRAPLFNTVGSPNNLGLFTVALLPLLSIFLLRSRQLLKIFLVVVMIVAFAILILINFKLGWWLLGIGSVLLIVFGVTKREVFGGNWLFLPMLFLILSLFFGVFGFQFPGLPSPPIEIGPTQKASLEVSLQNLKVRPILGSGPGSFDYNWSKFKPLEVNWSIFWNIRFKSSASKIFNTLNSAGILGIISLLALMGAFIYFGIKELFWKFYKSPVKFQGQPEEVFWLLGCGIFISFIILTLGYFLYPPSLSLDFTYFLLMGGFIALVAPPKREILFGGTSLINVAATFIFILVFVLGIGVFILGGQRYAADVNYLEAVKSWQLAKGQEALTYLERAVITNGKSDLYWRDLSQIYLWAISQETQRTDLAQEELNKRIQVFVSNAITAARTATDIEPLNVANWSVRGFVYQSLMGLVAGVEDWTIKSYEEALELEPSNPYFFTQKGITLLRQAVLLPQKEPAEKEKLFTEAEAELQKAINLKPDYAAAHFQTAIIYQLQGKISEAIKKLEETKSIAPADVGVAFQLGLIYYQNREYQKAQAEFERAVAVNPGYSNALYFLGLTYDKRGQKSQAIAQFEKVSELNPDNQEVKKVLSNLKAGRAALEGIVQEQPPTVPIEEKPPESLK